MHLNYSVAAGQRQIPDGTRLFLRDLCGGAAAFPSHCGPYMRRHYYLQSCHIRINSSGHSAGSTGALPHPFRQDNHDTHQVSGHQLPEPFRSRPAGTQCRRRCNGSTRRHRRRSSRRSPAPLWTAPAQPTTGRRTACATPSPVTSWPEKPWNAATPPLPSPVEKGKPTKVKGHQGQAHHRPEREPR